MPKPFLHRSGRWCVHYSSKLSPTGKDSFVYFDSEGAANGDLAARVGELQEHGRSLVTAQERQMIPTSSQQTRQTRPVPAANSHEGRRVPSSDLG